jgi:phage terminase small subunit
MVSEKVCQCLVADLWFTPGTPPVSTTNKTDHHDMTEIKLYCVIWSEFFSL